jgi:hypothetical protein
MFHKDAEHLPAYPRLVGVVTNPKSGKHVIDQAARLDTGADITVLPPKLKHLLGVKDPGIDLFQLADDSTTWIHPLNFDFPGLSPLRHVRCIFLSYPYVLLGNNVFQHWRFLGLSWPRDFLVMAE